MAQVSPQPFGFTDINEETVALALKLQLEEIQSIQSSGKGKEREDDVSDSTHTIQAFEEELRCLESTLSDRVMSRSLTRAVITDSALLTDLLARDDAIAKDRSIAERLSKGDEKTCEADGVNVDRDMDEVVLARLQRLYINGLDGEEISNEAIQDHSSSAESSEWAASRISKPAQLYDCVSCGEQKRDFEVLQAPCQHYYCQGCLSYLFERCTVDETLFPPRCCRQSISLISARLYLDAELAERFKEKILEFTSSDRTYCSQPTCSEFIKPANITTATSIGACSNCSIFTCTICKGNAHDGVCPNDTAAQLTLQLAQEEGWQRCYNCSTLVELEVGCNHMM